MTQPIVHKLCQENIVQLLEKSETFFIRTLTNEIVDTAEAYHCEVVVSKNRLLDAMDFWKGDIRRTRREGFSQQQRQVRTDYYDVELDHFKTAAFLAFWIRRTSPIIEIKRMYVDGDGPKRRIQERFFAFANEITALRLGTILCGFYEQQKWMAHENDGGVAKVGNGPIDYIHSKLRRWSFMSDFAMTLRHKSVSPHALNLIFKGMFAQQMELDEH